MDIGVIDSIESGLSYTLLVKTMSVLHTFIASSQYSDVLWSLGSLKYRRDMMSTDDQNRLIAVHV